MPDYWEDEYWDGPTDGVAWEDDDFDGASNFDEFVADTSPKSGGSVFVIDGLTFNSPAAITFMSSSNRLYDIYYSSNLVTGTWLDLQSDVQGTGGKLQIIDPDETAVYRAYRLKVKLP